MHKRTIKITMNSGCGAKFSLSRYLCLVLVLLLAILGCNHWTDRSQLMSLKEGFRNPPLSARPGVYWYFMDGNLDREAITADLESMRAAGIGQVVFLEVNVGVPRGKVDFFSPEWQDLFVHAIHEAERLGIRVTMGVGPGWTGSGGPWVKPEQSMQHLAASAIQVVGPSQCHAILPIPEPRTPFFGAAVLTPNLKSQRDAFYRDVAVLAFPTPNADNRIDDIDEKALYYRAPYSSMPGVKPYLPASATFSEGPDSGAIRKSDLIEITQALQPDGRILWQVPTGNWTIMRFGVRNNGAVTRPAPEPGLGFECDKLDRDAFDAHFDAFIGKLLQKVGPRSGDRRFGWTMLHMDSWEMGAQNWTGRFRDEFKKRRGYDPLPYLPTFTGRVVGTKEESERFLWDLRITAQDLVLENHAGRIKELGRRYGLQLSIEPYDMNPCADLVLGAVADVPMAEFWFKGLGFNTSFSCIEAASIAHVLGQPVVSAEAFTSDWNKEGFTAFPGNMKNQGDWAFCTGINQFVYHTFAHKPYGDHLRPGLTMGGYGVHWDRGQTWWPMVSGYHQYVSRCSYLLQQGRTVADVLYLTPEGAPQVFRPPASALVGCDTIPDRKGYNFDGCSANMLIEFASVKDNRIIFPGGARYRLLVLPAIDTMTPGLVDKIAALAQNGATVVGNPPLKSPSLVNHPACDHQVRATAARLWASHKPPATILPRQYGKGKIVWGGELAQLDSSELYPHYDLTAALLKKLGVAQDFEASGSLRYTHRQTEVLEIYFVSNKTDQAVATDCFFNVSNAAPELWDPLTGEIRPLVEFKSPDGRMLIPLQFAAYQSYFIVFQKEHQSAPTPGPGRGNFPELTPIAELTGAWEVSFDPNWGGTEPVTFEKLEDWTRRPEPGIQFYSGIARYRKAFEFSEAKPGRFYLHLGKVNCLARVRINGKDAGMVWTAPWQIEITRALKPGTNQLEIEVANLWVNRLIGDEQLSDDGIANGAWPEWLLSGTSRPSGRFTFCTHKFYDSQSPLQQSGLLGPVQIMAVF